MISLSAALKLNFFQNSKLFHVRPVTQGDVYRAEAEEIPRIFQVSYCIFFCSVILFNKGSEMPRNDK